MWNFDTGPFITVQLLSHVQLFMTPWTAVHQTSLSLTISQSLSKFVSIESVMPSNHFICCHPLLLLPSIFLIRGFSSEMLGRVWLFATLQTVTCQLLCPWNSPGKNTGVGSHSLLQGTFPTQGSNPAPCIAGRFFMVWVRYMYTYG